jgi:PAS domain S-box-containing protein
MTDTEQTDLELRLLLLTPTGKDATLVASVLREAGMNCASCAGMDCVIRELRAGAGALLLAEEALDDGEGSQLAAALDAAPPWSDLPVLLLTGIGADSAIVGQAVESLGNVTLLERPTRVAAIVSASRSALRARERQYQVRNQLEERERHLQTQALLGAIVASSDDAIVSKDLEGIILTWNAGAERLFGYSAEEVIGRPITLLIPPERHDEEAGLLRQLRRGERIDHFETVRVAKDGRRIDISLTVSPIRDAEGKVIGASKVARDVTPRKVAEAALRDADRRKDEFLATLAHELRNPLAPIRNSLHILRIAGSLDPTSESVCEMLERQVNHMVRLVDDLMEVSRITRGTIELRRERIELAAIIRSAVETSKPLIDLAGHQLSVALPKEPVLVDGDLVRLSQVFANLLNNAANYCDRAGQITITARREEGAVAVSVRDTGIGIAPDMLPRVFDMFTQIDRAGGRAQGGLGIGLALVRALVDMHGGRVEARSGGPGRGSEFVVRLPVLAGAPLPIGTRLPARPSDFLPRRRVLVVDDNHDAADSLGMLLRILGADVRVVYDGAAALEAIESFRPIVAFLDIGMPEMDGHELARQIHQRFPSERITLVALTGWSQEEDRERTRLAGFDHHLIKPADISKLQTLLGSLDNPSESANHRR